MKWLQNGSAWEVSNDGEKGEDVNSREAAAAYRTGCNPKAPKHPGKRWLHFLSYTYPFL